MRENADNSHSQRSLSVQPALDDDGIDNNNDNAMQT